MTSPSPSPVNVGPTRCAIAGPHTRLAVFRNTGGQPIHAGDARVTPTTGTIISPGATVEYRHPAADVWIVAAAPTPAEITHFSRVRDVVAYDTGVPAELLGVGDEADLRDAAARITAWKNS